jgi:hypothetical protein
MGEAIPAYRQISIDARTRGNARDVYAYLHERLDVRFFRAVKHSAIEAALRMPDSSVGDALDLLCRLGYLDRGDRINRVRLYRLVYSVNPTKPE